MKKSGLALNSKSPLSGFKLMVTPGLIIGTITVVRPYEDAVLFLLTTFTFYRHVLHSRSMVYSPETEEGPSRRFNMTTMLMTC